MRPPDGVQALRFLSPIALRYVPRSGQISMAGALGILLLWPWDDLRGLEAGLTLAGVVLTTATASAS